MWSCGTGTRFSETIWICIYILKYVIVNLVGRNLHLVDIFIYDIYIHIDIGT